MFYERQNILPVTDIQLYEYADYDKPGTANITSVKCYGWQITCHINANTWP